MELFFWIEHLSYRNAEMARVIDMTKFTSTVQYEPSFQQRKEHSSLMNFVLLIAGVGLCFTGIGMFFGIIMIIAAVYGMWCNGSATIKGAWLGKCPKCSKEIFWCMHKELKQGRLNCLELEGHPPSAGQKATSSYAECALIALHGGSR